MRKNTGINIRFAVIDNQTGLSLFYVETLTCTNTETWEKAKKSKVVMDMIYRNILTYLNSGVKPLITKEFTEENYSFKVLNYLSIGSKDSEYSTDIIHTEIDLERWETYDLKTMFDTVKNKLNPYDIRFIDNLIKERKTIYVKHRDKYEGVTTVKGVTPDYYHMIGME